MRKYEVIEDNGGGLTLVVFNENGDVDYLHSGYEYGTQYCGYNIFCGEVYKGDYEPIIDIETYNKVLSLLKRQGKTVGRKRIEPLVKISR